MERNGGSLNPNSRGAVIADRHLNLGVDIMDAHQIPFTSEQEYLWQLPNREYRR